MPEKYDKVLHYAESSGNLRRPFIPAWVREILPKLKGAPLAVLISYWSHANKEGLAWPSIGTLVRETGYGRNTAKEARKILVTLGLLIPAEQRRTTVGRYERKPFYTHTAAQKVDHGTVAQSTVAHFTGARSTVAQKVGQEGSQSEGSPNKKREPRKKEGSASPRSGAPAPVGNSEKPKSYQVDEVIYG